MSDESEPDLDTLKKQIESLQKSVEMLEEKSGKKKSEEESKPKSRGIEGLFVSRSEDGKKIVVDLGSMGEFVDEVVNGIRGEIEKSVFIDRNGIAIRNPMVKPDAEIDETVSAEVFAALGNEHRVRILKELETGGMYANELEEEIPVSASTLSKHLKTLEEQGLVHQEASRGRYLITLSGRKALMAARKFSS